MSIATTILEQLGGNHFRVMVGAKNLTDGGEYLSFRFGRNKTSANYCRVTLTPLDLYTVEFYQLRKFTMKKLETFENIYDDQLRPTFEEFTGLATKLF